MGEYLIYRIPAVLIALTVHEYSHGRIAYHFGDPTAKMQGRLTLNPLSHMDPIGTLLLFFFGFGWAKPVPVNPYNFRRDVSMKDGMMYVSLAGPLSNFVMAFIFIGITDVFARVFLNQPFVSVDMIMNFAHSSPGLDNVSMSLVVILSSIVIINVYLGLFNLLPIPPLDGSKILSGLLPAQHENIMDFLNQYGFIILIVLVFTGTFGSILVPLAYGIMEVLHLPFSLFNFLMGV